MKKTVGVFTAIFFVCTFLAGQVLAVEIEGEPALWPINDNIRVTQFMAQTVSDQQRESVGDVHDIIFDKDGNIHYLVLIKGGVFGIGADLIPIPWKDETITIERNAIILNMDKQKIDEAPGFAADEWHRFMKQEFRDEIHGYYGTKK